MNRLKPVTLSEFLDLVEYAQHHHSSLNEPIPEIATTQYDTISYCLNIPFQTFDGKLLYRGFWDKASILFYIMNKNHVLLNGNKRMACLTLGWFCHKNSHELQPSWEDFYEVALHVTNSDPNNKDVLLYALAATLKKFSKSRK